MSAPHTPGPWTVDENVPNKVWDINSEGRYWKAVAATTANKMGAGDMTAEEAAANARLIAAAPELLEACKLIAAANGVVLRSDDARAAVAAVVAAIAKATGT